MNIGNRDDASSMVTAGATVNTTEENSRASRESGVDVYTKSTRAHTQRELIYWGRLVEQVRIMSIHTGSLSSIDFDFSVTIPTKPDLRADNRYQWATEILWGGITRMATARLNRALCAEVILRRVS